jgi:CRISPR-associated protein Cmr3
MSKETWLIEPHDSLIVRDGRPFNATAGSRAKSLDFPFPSTLIGSVRTRIGLENAKNSWEKFDDDSIKELLEIEMFGALLAEIKDDGKLEFFAPTPADSLLVKLGKEDEDDEKKNNLFPLLPLKNEYSSNLPNDLHLLGIKETVKEKPSSEVKFWHWCKFESWLIGVETKNIKPEELGIGGLISDQRTHVKIDYERKSNIDGGLFQTRGLEFAMKDKASKDFKFKRLALALQVDYKKEFEKKLESGLFPLGGERRVVRWSKKVREFPKCPQEVMKGIKTSGHCRLVLLTPAYFENGFLPDENKLCAKVKAVAVNRSQVISGWDFKLRKPKPTRRLTPAGTVYFLEIEDKDKVEDFINQTWFKNIGDCKQTKLDGFGLAVLGNWDGNTEHEI